MNHKKRNHKRAYGFVSACILGVSFVLMGLFQGQHADVFAKAIRICLECVGIG